MNGLFGLVTLGLWIFCLIDAITTAAGSVRNLGKTLWIVLIIFLPLAGSIAWIVAGRPRRVPSMPYKGSYGPTVSDRPEWHPSLILESDEEFQTRFRARAEEQRRAYRESKRREIDEGDHPTT